jgi:hypothetical protein
VQIWVEGEWLGYIDGDDNKVVFDFLVFLSGALGKLGLVFEFFVLLLS